VNRALVDQIANAVLYEGYILYPYRPALKNRQRWTFGGLYPRAFSEEQGSDAWSMQTECLVRDSGLARLEIIVRFLQLTDRRVGRVRCPVANLSELGEFDEVEAFQVGDRLLQVWQEATERSLSINKVALTDLHHAPVYHEVGFPATCDLEPVRGASGTIEALLIREQATVTARMAVSVETVQRPMVKIRVRIENATPLPNGLTDRNQAQLHSLMSTHALLGVRGGQFVSLVDPPDDCRDLAASCENTGAWPVLVGSSGTSDTVLASPIILPDDPRIAPESPGDLFDGAEIDEILSLRIMTLTDEERQAAMAIDDRARLMLQRTESLARDQLTRLHGTVRGMTPSPGRLEHE
jgi:hypothetical protein